MKKYLSESVQKPFSSGFFPGSSENTGSEEGVPTGTSTDEPAFAAEAGEKPAGRGLADTLSTPKTLRLALALFIASLCLEILYLMQPALFSPTYPLFPAGVAALLVVIAFSKGSETP